MITENYNGKTVYAHAEQVSAQLIRMGWRVLFWGQELPVKILSSKETCGHWYYAAWVPLPSGRKMLLELPGWDLFATYQEAIAERLAKMNRKQLYKYARHYRVRKPGVWARLKNFLAKADQAGVAQLPPRDERNAGRGQTLPAPHLRGFYEKTLCYQNKF